MTPSIQSVVETVIYVDDLPRAVDFYAHILGLERHVSDSRFAAAACLYRDLENAQMNAAPRNSPANCRCSELTPHRLPNWICKWICGARPE